MKNLLLSFAVATLLPLSLFAQDPNKTLVKTIPPGNASVIDFGIKNKGMVAEAWEKEDLRLTIEIHANMPEAIMDQLIKAGRYTVSSVNDGETLKITAPNLDKAVSIKGIDLEEELYLNVNTPSNFIRNGNLLTKDMNMITALIAQGGGRLGKSEIDQMRKIGKNIAVEYKVVSSVSAEKFTEMVKAKSKNKDTMSLSKEEGTPAATMRLNGTKPTLKDMGLNKGDILIGGEPIDFE